MSDGAVVAEPLGPARLTDIDLPAICLRMYAIFHTVEMPRAEERSMPQELFDAIDTLECMVLYGHPSLAGHASPPRLVEWAGVIREFGAHYRLAGRGPIVVNPAIYHEVVARYSGARQAEPSAADVTQAVQPPAMTVEHMRDAEALIAAIKAAPDDDAPRLVFADWLDEHGQPERADFIRREIALHRRRRSSEQLHRDSPYFRILAEQLLIGFEHGPIARYRKRTFTRRFALQTSRGMVESISGSSLDCLAHLDAIRKLEPIRDVRLRTTVSAGWPVADGLTRQECVLLLFDRNGLPAADRILQRARIRLGDVRSSGQPLLQQVLEAEWPGITFHLHGLT